MVSMTIFEREFYSGWFVFINWVMILYYDFEGRRMHAEVTWPGGGGTIQVQLTDKRLKDLPADLLFDMNRVNRITYLVENPANKRLSELQLVLSKRLQEFANQL